MDLGRGLWIKEWFNGIPQEPESRSCVDYVHAAQGLKEKEKSDFNKPSTSRKWKWKGSWRGKEKKQLPQGSYYHQRFEGFEWVPEQPYWNFSVPKNQILTLVRNRMTFSQESYDHHTHVIFHVLRKTEQLHILVLNSLIYIMWSKVVINKTNT